MNFRDLFGSVLEWVYPSVCIHCGKPGAIICETCLAALEPVGKHYCSRCGKPLKFGQRCGLCRRSDFRFQSSRAPYLYEGPAAAMVKRLKYRGCMSLIPIMADLLTDFWHTLDWNAELVIPVPLSKRRRTERGFNQSELLGAAFAKRAGLPIRPGALMKTRDTLQQVGLDADQRRENLREAFSAEPVMVKGKQILLLDDVMTTGSTFAECSAVLLEAGAKSVRCLSFATTTADHGKKAERAAAQQ